MFTNNATWRATFACYITALALFESWLLTTSSATLFADKTYTSTHTHTNSTKKRRTSIDGQLNRDQGQLRRSERTFHTRPRIERKLFNGSQASLNNSQQGQKLGKKKDFFVQVQARRFVGNNSNLPIIRRKSHVAPCKHALSSPVLQLPCPKPTHSPRHIHSLSAAAADPCPLVKQIDLFVAQA